MNLQLPYDSEFLKSLSNNTKYMFACAQKAVETAQFALREYLQVIKKIPDSTKILAENGWYMPFDFHPVIVNRMSANIKEGNSLTTDNEMINFFDRELSNIQMELNKKFPDRSNAINAGIRAHKKQEYYLSIPVFFAQIEGICNELTGIRFFTTSKKQPKTNLWVKKFENDSIPRILLEPLYISGPMRELQDFDNPLGINRHDVLHGNSVNYGDSKVNGYKVFSLLNYISDTVFEAKRFLDTKDSK